MQQFHTKNSISHAYTNGRIPSQLYSKKVEENKRMVHKQTTLDDNMHHQPINLQPDHSPPLVLASQHQTKVKQNPEEKPPSHSDPQAVPLAEISDPLLLQ